MMGPPSATAPVLTQGLALKSLATLANAGGEADRFAASLAAGPAALPLLSASPTALWRYNGQFPGPVIDVREGDRVRVALDNRLPIDTTVHWHGLPVPAEQDGNPVDPVRPGAPPGTAVTRKRLVLTPQGMAMMMGGFPINGRSFDMNRVDLVSTVGDLESRDIVNDTMMDHPIHIHGTQFQLVSRESRGVVTPAPLAAWLDTVDVPSGTTATISVRQELPGKRRSTATSSSTRTPG
jgi:FtsP/CotA-like multicopper oxidase with cupredoxin domain